MANETPESPNPYQSPESDIGLTAAVKPKRFRARLIPTMLLGVYSSVGFAGSLIIFALALHRLLLQPENSDSRTVEDLTHAPLAALGCALGFAGAVLWWKGRWVPAIVATVLFIATLAAL